MSAARRRLAWVVNAYLIGFGCLLLVAGRLGDLIGRKRVFVAGVIVFTAASMAWGVSRGRDSHRRPLRTGHRRSHHQHRRPAFG